MSKFRISAPQEPTPFFLLVILQNNQLPEARQELLQDVSNTQTRISEVLGLNNAIRQAEDILDTKQESAVALASSVETLEDLRENDAICVVCNAPIEVVDWDRVLSSYDDDDLDDVDAAGVDEVDDDEEWTGDVEIDDGHVDDDPDDDDEVDDPHD